MKILIVDDSEQNLYLLRMMLEGNGYQVETATNGSDALDKARRALPALIVSDILMPIMDGFALCREWQKDESLSKIPFVFYSATYTDAKDQEFALSLGAVRFIVKPQETEVFVDILRQVFRQAEAGEACVPEHPVEEETVYLRSYNERLIHKLEDKISQLERAHRRLNTLYNASDALTGIRPMGELVPHTLQIAVEAMGFDRARYFDYNPERQEFGLFEEVGFPDEEMVALRRELVFHLGEERGLVGVVGQTRESLVVADTYDEPRWIRINNKIRSALFVPVVHKGDLLGVAGFYSTEPDYFGSEDVRNVTALASSLASAIKNAELVERLSQSEARYRRLAENAPDLIFRYRLAPTPGFEYVSPAATEITGYAPEEYYAEPDLGLKLVHADDRPLVAAYYREGSNSSKPLTFRCIRKDGTVIWTEQRSVPIWDGAGNLVALEGIIRDVTERKRAEEEIRRRAAQQEALSAIIVAAAAAVDLSNLLETALDHMLQAVNLTQGFIWAETQHVVRGVPVEVALALCEEATQPNTEAVPGPLVVADWQQVADESSLAAIRSTMVPVNVRASLTVPILDGDEHMGGFSVVSTEPRNWTVEEIALMEAVGRQLGGVVQRLRLEEKQRRLSTAVEQSADAVAITDTDDIIVYVNPAFEQITQFSREEALGRSFDILKSDKLDTDVYREIRDTLSAGRTWKGRITNRKKDGSLFAEDSTISPVRSWTGEIVNYVTVMRDVTRELQLESQFLQAQKMEVVGQLAGGVAHDFNNLLTVIYLSTRLMEKSLRTEDPLWEHLQRIREASQRATALTKQLLAFSRQDVVQPQVLDLNAVVENLFKMLKRMIGEDIELRIELGDDLWPAFLDLTQVEQVIINLAVNARDAMPLGGTLTIETANVNLDQDYCARNQEVEPGEYLLLSVSDTGVGMSDEVLARIFEPFFSTKEPGKGTGLGLPTVYGIIKQNGGHISVDSKVGQGTTFKIYLPHITEPEARRREKPSPQPASPLRGTETILLAEDHEGIRDLAASVLKGEGYSVLIARNGVEALRIGAQHPGPLHLLVTDAVMPEMSGGELANRLREQRPELRVLFISGHTDEMIFQHDILAKGVALLPKPFIPESLIAKVRAILAE